MNNPFAWPEEAEATTSHPVEYAFPEDDPQVIARTVQYVAPSPVSGAVRPEWDARLVIDYVLGVSTEAILEEYNLTHQAFERVKLDIGFMGKVAALKKELEKDGATFALKAKLQAEVLLEESFKMAMNSNVDDRVRAKLIADTVRWAGFDRNGPAVDGTGGFSITINLNGKKGDTYDMEAEDV
ncbi:hypothetical protein D3C85_285580 [compost metagenome]